MVSQPNEDEIFRPAGLSLHIKLISRITPGRLGRSSNQKAEVSQLGLEKTIKSGRGISLLNKPSMVKTPNKLCLLTLARTGGGLVQPPPLRFFADSEKTAARSAAGFWCTLWGKPCATFSKKKIDQVRSGHGAMTS